MFVPMINFIRKRIRKHKKLFLFTFSGCIILSLLTVWANYEIISNSSAFLYNDLNDIPNVETGLLLGTSKYLKSGKPNEYFQNRIAATVNLFKSGKIKYLIISGDNSRAGYNEPLDMKNDLVQQGIPDSAIYLDLECSAFPCL
jgi:SanA protein